MADGPGQPKSSGRAYLGRDAPQAAPSQRPRLDAQAFQQQPVPAAQLQLPSVGLAPGQASGAQPSGAGAHPASVLRPELAGPGGAYASHANAGAGGGPHSNAQPDSAQWPWHAHDMRSQHAAAMAEQSAAFAAHFTQMVAAAAAAGAMSAIQHCSGGAPLSPAHGQATFSAAANAAAMFAAARATELLPHGAALFADPRAGPSAYPMAGSAGPGQAAYGGAPLQPGNANMQDGNTGAAAHAMASRQATAAETVTQAGQPSLAQAAGTATAKPGAQDAKTPGDVQPGQSAVSETLKRSRCGRSLPETGELGQQPARAVVTPSESELVQKVQICAWLVRSSLSSLHLCTVACCEVVSRGHHGGCSESSDLSPCAGWRSRSSDAQAVAVRDCGSLRGTTHDLDGHAQR